MITSITGHRPQKIGGFKTPNPTFNKICKEIEQFFLTNSPEKIISGMALGIDSWSAKIAIKLDIPFIAAVPFIGQEKIWPEASKKEYQYILNKAVEVVVVSEGGYSPEKMQIRNEWMVDNSDHLLAVWDGTNGGTKNCINYAKKINRKITYIKP